MKNSDFTMDERMIIKKALFELVIDMDDHIGTLPETSVAIETCRKSRDMANHLLNKVKLFI